MTVPVGLLIGSHIPPADIPHLAALAEEKGFSEVWLTEDLWYSSGVVAATAALAATSTIPVGLGIQSAVTRHVSIQALDFSTIEAIFPGRFWPGIGLGLPVWLDQMGLMPSAPLRSVREAVENTKALLAGETVTSDGVHRLSEVKLQYPAESQPPMYIGAIGPKNIKQAGRIADGFVTSNGAGTAYIEWARKLFDEGAMKSETSDRKRFVTLALFCCDEDPQVARDLLRSSLAFYLLALQGTQVLSVYGIEEQLAELATGGVERVAAEMPDEWLEDLAIAGTPEQCAAKIQKFIDAGSDSVVLFPAPFERGEELVRLAGDRVIPLMRAS